MHGQNTGLFHRDVLIWKLSTAQTRTLISQDASDQVPARGAAPAPKSRAADCVHTYRAPRDGPGGDDDNHAAHAQSPPPPRFVTKGRQRDRALNASVAQLCNTTSSRRLALQHNWATLPQVAAFRSGYKGAPARPSARWLRRATVQHYLRWQVSAAATRVRQRGRALDGSVAQLCNTTSGGRFPQRLRGCASAAERSMALSRNCATLPQVAGFRSGYEGAPARPSARWLRRATVQHYLRWQVSAAATRVRQRGRALDGSVAQLCNTTSGGRFSQRLRGCASAAERSMAPSRNCATLPQVSGFRSGYEGAPARPSARWLRRATVQHYLRWQVSAAATRVRQRGRALDGSVAQLCNTTSGGRFPQRLRGCASAAERSMALSRNCATLPQVAGFRSGYEGAPARPSARWLRRATVQHYLRWQVAAAATRVRQRGRALDASSTQLCNTASSHLAATLLKASVVLVTI
ncbi:uncharacterized protein LOC142558165 [Dermacentor variabilis]|uniref:uncharacterized protein LOC142558165 n=1 Tax=Dermacentor variabilis TaxID=34621 RepID=UPI003F5B5246